MNFVIQHFLKGPYNPLEMSVNGINHNAVSKIIRIESQSVNSVLLDTDPNDYHERQVYIFTYYLFTQKHGIAINNNNYYELMYKFTICI